MGLALATVVRFADAADAYERAIEIEADNADAHNGLGGAMSGLRRWDDAIASYRRAIAIEHDHANAHAGLSLALLSKGSLVEGFEEYRWRWQVAGIKDRVPAVSCPQWEGEDLTGKTILAYCEQGYGDSLQFIRYVRPLSNLASKVVVVTSEPLVGLFQSIANIDVRADLSDGGCDYWTPLMCLPRLFGTSIDTIPADVPYLAADPEKAMRWGERIAGTGGGIRVGLVWAGEPRKHDPRLNAIDRRRSLSLRQFAPLARAAPVHFYSLQKGDPSAEARNPPNGMELTDFTAVLDDFGDTAALLANLDLVISVDTSVAHLAGALAKPVWILSRFDGCWRWLNGREDSPWYPTARLFHQKTPGAWDEVMQRVAVELSAFAERSSI
jgi:tetratricopeptide (TPR) repeat protein